MKHSFRAANEVNLNVPHFLVILALMATGIFSATGQQQIRLNQVGFYPDAAKIAIAVGATSDTFYVVAEGGGEVVYTGILGAAQTWNASGEQVRIAEFTTFKATGSYLLRCAGCADSYPFSIGNKTHLAVTKGSIKALYYNRCSFELTEPFAGIYARKAGHTDTAVEIHGSAASASRPAGTKIVSPGGWYDAGDYGKYIVNSGISTYTLLAAYEAFPDFYDTLALTIPESSNNLPDLLDEALFNLRWMLTMQDPEDGGVYHKLTSANFCGMVMPDADKLKRYAVAKSTTATLDFAAVCAQAARIFGKFSAAMPGFADSCREASLRAWQWARANPAIAYKNANTSSPAISTGEYGDGNPADELIWAATELYIATKQDSFFTVAFPAGQLTGVSKVPSWPTVGTLGLYSLFLCKETMSKVTGEQVVAALKALADSSMNILKSSPYHIAMRDADFIWGSNSVAANRGMSLIMAYLGSRGDEYKAAALDQLDYLLGRNPTGYSYVTGYGDKTPMFIHHRTSTADGIDAPVPGFVAGGPNPRLQDTADCGGDYYPSRLAALAYLDSTCSYASNEVAINWNAPFIFLAGAIEALFGKDAVQKVKLPGKTKKGKASSVIRQQHGRLQIRFPFSGEAVVTVENLQGKLLSKRQCSASVNLAADWPLQVVFVTVRPSVSPTEIPLISGVFLLGTW